MQDLFIIILFHLGRTFSIFVSNFLNLRVFNDNWFFQLSSAKDHHKIIITDSSYSADLCYHGLNAGAEKGL